MKRGELAKKKRLPYRLAGGVGCVHCESHCGA